MPVPCRLFLDLLKETPAGHQSNIIYRILTCILINLLKIACEVKQINKARAINVTPVTEGV
jgi:hypothetical protein